MAQNEAVISLSDYTQRWPRSNSFPDTRPMSPKSDLANSELLKQVALLVDEKLDEALKGRIEDLMETKLRSYAAARRGEWVASNHLIYLSTVAFVEQSMIAQPYKSSTFDLRRWKKFNREVELALKGLSAILLFAVGIALILHGRIEYVFITAIGTTLILLDILMKVRVRSWKQQQ